MNYLPICAKSEYVPITFGNFDMANMADNSGNMQHFWEKSEQHLQTFSSDFNFQMNQKEFQLEYIIVDRNPIGF